MNSRLARNRKLTKLMELSKAVRYPEFSVCRTHSLIIGKRRRPCRSLSIIRPNLASISSIAADPVAAAPAAPAARSRLRTTSLKRKSQTTFVISSYGIFPEIDGSQGPNGPYAGCGCGGGTGRLTTGVVPLTGGCLAGVCIDLDGDATDRCTDVAREVAANRACECFGMAGLGFVMIGPFPDLGTLRA
jgi:hypothetical protein